MTCFTPLQGYYSSSINSKGRRIITFDEREANSEPFYLPCGRCCGCRLERARQWAMRCVHESQLYLNNCFITLTYDDDHLPKDGGLVKRDFQLFMKKFRKFVDVEEFGFARLRYFHCGEYGERTNRPHYHACIFGFDFPDKVLFRDVNGIKLYTSKMLSDLWGKGFVTVGDVNFESASYVARYVLKKSAAFYGTDSYLDKETGVLKQREYVTMSRRPGIGYEWYKKFKSDIYPHDFLYMRGRKMRGPKYYDALFELDDPVTCARLKEERSVSVVMNEDSTIERLRVREQVKLAELTRLPRNLD